MAEKVEIDIPGIGIIEAKNAASEATLQEILNVLKSSQKDANKNAKDAKGKGSSSSGGGAEKANAAMDALGKQTQSAAKGLGALGIAGKTVGAAFNVVGKTAGIMVGGFNRMAVGAGIAAGATKELGVKALAAGESMTDLIERMANVGDSTTAAANALRVIPGVGGVLANVLGAAAGAVENTVKAYQTAASVGATFGGSVQEMSRAASGAGMTLDKFAGLMKDNAENLMLLGGTTENGAKQFASLAKSMQSSGVGAELQRLGYTTDQINGGMARYIGILGKTGALNNMTTSQLVASSGAYMKELDALAKITGVSREEKEKEQQALMRDAKVRAAMAGLDADQQRQMMAYITSFPKEQQGAIADMIATGNVTTEEAIKLQSMLPGVAQQTMAFGRTLQAGGKINQDVLNQAKNNAINEAKESVKRNKTRGMYDEEAGKQYVAMADLAAQKVDGYSQAIGEQAKATEKANLAENLTKAKQRLSEFSNNFQMALANSGMLDSLMNVFELLGNFVLTTIVPIFNIFADALNVVIPMITGFLTPAMKMLGEFIQDKIVPAFQILGAWVQDGLMPVFVRMWEIVSTGIEALSSLVGGVFGATDVLEDVLEPALYAISDFMEDYLSPILATLAVVAIPSVIAKFAAMAVSMLSTIAGFIALNLPMIAFTAVVAGTILLFKKFGVDLGVVGDAFKWVGTMFKSVFLKIKEGFFTLLNKIPGMRGDFDEDLKEIAKEQEANAANREELEKDMAKRRQANLKAEEDKEKSREERDKQRAARREQREAQAIDRKEKREIKAIDNKEERETAAGEAKDVSVDMSGPVEMLKTYANQQKSGLVEKPTSEGKPKEEKSSGGGTAAAPSMAGNKIEGLGKIAAQFESGGKAGTISSGHGDFGGKSYGAFQLSSKTGDVDKFLKSSGYAEQFKGMQVGSKDFDAKWKELADKDKGFAEAQQKHAVKTHYDPQMAKLQKSGIDLSGKGAGVQEAIMSTANQYGANSDVIVKALKDKNVGKMSDKEIINAIQDYKANTVKERFKSSSAAVQAGVSKRIEQERSALLGVEGPVGRPKDDSKSGTASTGGQQEGRTAGGARSETRSTEGKVSDATPSGSMQSLIKDGIVPTTIAFQDLVSKGIKPFQGLMNNLQGSKGTVKPEDSLSKGEELISQVTKIGKEEAAKARAEAASKDPRRLDFTNIGAPISPLKDIKNAPSTMPGAVTPLTEIAEKARKEEEEKAKAKAAEEEKRKQEQQSTMMAGPGQNNTNVPVEDLNKALAELIAISRKTAELNESQLSVQKGLSGDMFA